MSLNRSLSLNSIIIPADPPTYVTIQTVCNADNLHNLWHLSNVWAITRYQNTFGAKIDMAINSTYSPTTLEKAQAERKLNVAPQCMQVYLALVGSKARQASQTHC